MATAQRALDNLDCLELEEHIGCFLLGSTAPDIRIMTGRPREETHFFDVKSDHGISGILKLLEHHPHLAQLKGRPKAFMSGYLTHLAVDELWVDQVYRPYFGAGSHLGGDLEANLMDRLLQFHIDRGERLDRDRFASFCDYMFTADAGDEIGFIDVPTLLRWRDVVTNILKQDPSWEAFRTFTTRRFGGEEGAEPEQVRAFFESIPEALERTLAYVTHERLEAFKADAIRRSTEAVTAYLS